MGEAGSQEGHTGQIWKDGRPYITIVRGFPEEDGTEQVGEGH